MAIALHHGVGYGWDGAYKYQITDTENAKVVADYPGLVVVRAKKTQYDDNVYLIGKSGIVQTFVVSGTDTDWDENEHIYDDWERTTSYSSVDAIWRLSYKGDRLYYIKKPQTQTPKYDIYNATTGKYFEYDLDEQPEPYRDGEGAVTDVYRFVKDGKVGMLKSDATILYEAEYDDIDRNAFNTDFSDESIRESDDKFFQAMKRDENSDKNLYGIVDSKGLWDGVCKYRSITSNTSGSRICVKNVDEETAVMDINTGELLTGFTGSRIYSLGDGCFLKSNGLGMYDEGKQIREIIGAEYKVEGDLRSEIQLNIKRLMDIGCYRGVRHRLGLPVRGQSTKNNARTRKGRKKTVANKKKATK